MAIKWQLRMAIDCRFDGQTWANDPGKDGFKMNVQNELVLMDPAVLIREVDRYLANKNVPVDCRIEVREAIAVQALRAVGRVTSHHGKHEKRTAFSAAAEGFGLRDWQIKVMRANAEGRRLNNCD